jgi:glycosyltransferase involved in cell wall biosynthesis
MHILFLTDNFPPEVNAPASRTFEHCREWVKLGHRVTVITCAPNFPKGQLFPGYRNCLLQSELLEGIRVIRVWSYIAANEGFSRRILDYQSFMASAVLASPFVCEVDLVIGTSPQFFTVCAAYVISVLKRIPFVFELRDLWPESIKAVGAMHNRFALGLLENLAQFLYRKAAGIISVTHSFRHILTEKGIDPSKIEVVTNGVDIARFNVQTKDFELIQSLGLGGKFVVGYIGTHGMAHGLTTILKAASRLRRHHDGGKFCFLFIGDGARKLELIKQARQMGLDNAIFLDSVPKGDVVKYWSLLDVSVIHLKKNELFNTVIPSKLFEGMAMGIPVLHGVAGESAEIVEREGVGLLFEPENDEQLCERLLSLQTDKTLYKTLSDNAVNAAQHYQRSNLAKQMLTVLEKIISP